MQPSNGSSQHQESMSIEESNKIRASLGLKPLQVGPVDNVDEEEDDRPALLQGETRHIEDSHEFIHKPASNIQEKLQVDKLREKIALRREKRKQEEKLSKVRNLADSDSDEETGAAWVEKNRTIVRERELAAKRAKQLDELDAEFGVDDMVEEEVARDSRHAYDAGHLRGLKVQHHHTRFADGNTILTLADANVLADDEDTLVNVNLIDLERAEKNVEIRSSKDKEETEYEAPEVDDMGRIRTGALLKKYDEELHGAKTDSFRLGSRGHAKIQEDLSSLGEKQRKLAKLRQLQSLNRADNQLAMEYMTQDEASAVFKKPKRRKKKKHLTADDLVPVDDGSSHHGSRRNRNIVSQEVNGDASQDEPLAAGEERVKSLRELMQEDDDAGARNGAESMEVDNDEDETLNDDFELQQAIQRSRRSNLASRNKPKVEKIKEMLDQSKPFDTSSFGNGNDFSEMLSQSRPDGQKDALTLNREDEFCRTLGEMPTYGLSGNRVDEEANTILSQPKKVVDEEPLGSSAWAEVGIDTTAVDLTEAHSGVILEEEPGATKGIGSAMQLVLKKGLWEAESGVKKGSTMTLHSLKAINYTIDDKAGEDDRRRERFGGPSMSFSEKEHYRPNITLEYVDDEGRKLIPKEAFRYLSHKFHGKGSGKNKTEKRMKKWNEESLMKSMSSGDTPLQTVERQMEKQKQMGTSHLVISGTKNQEAAAMDEAKIRKQK